MAITYFGLNCNCLRCTETISSFDPVMKMIKQSFLAWRANEAFTATNVGTFEVPLWSWACKQEHSVNIFQEKKKKSRELAKFLQQVGRSSLFLPRKRFVLDDAGIVGFADVTTKYVINNMNNFSIIEDIWIFLNIFNVDLISLSLVLKFYDDFFYFHFFIYSFYIYYFCICIWTTTTTRWKKHFSHV